MSVVEDIMFVNGMEFLVSISIHVKFTMVHYIGKNTTGNISKSLEHIDYVCYICGIFVETLYIYMEFENIRIIIPVRSTLNTTAAD